VKSILHIVLLLLIFSSVAFAQKKNPPANTKSSPIEILNADRVVRDMSPVNSPQKKIKPERILGNVIVKHESTMMYCDSAWYYQQRNVLYAFGHVHMKEGDSLNVYGDSLFFDGNAKYGKLRGHIRMVEQDMTMETDSIEFDTKLGIGRYTTGGTVRSVKNQNTLTSKKGEYHSKTKDIFFSDSVFLKSPEYTMTTDTLRYHTITETAYFMGSTVFRDKQNIVFCKGGFYNTRTEKSQFLKEVYMSNVENTLRGDTIEYDRLKGIGIARGPFTAEDTLNDMILSGTYGWFDETNKKSLITGNALMTRIFEKDSLYLHADTLRGEKDVKTDKQLVRAYHHVRFYKSDIQGKCDSISFNEQDSILHLWGKPVLWHEANQLSAEKMEIKIAGKKIDKVELFDNCFIASSADTVGYNQIKGRKMLATFKGDKIDKVYIFGNGQAIYYAGEEGKKPMGMNKIECSDIVIYIGEKKLERVHFLTEPKGEFFPLEKINPKDALLKDFVWYGKYRPTDKADVFRKV
jgi:lipopolysaccharide export system protein LptA